MDQTSSKLDSQKTQKRLRSEETEKIEHCIEELQKAYTNVREGLSKAFPRNSTELPINSFKEIAEKLPKDMTEMMEIDQMTGFKFDIFGTQFLAICKKYINFSKNSQSSKQPRNSVESIKDVIEGCPVCLNICRSKTLYQCENGHVVCDQCYPKLKPKNCPTCRNEMFKTRSLILEKLLERLPTPCQYVGCSEEVMFDELENHEKECLFRLVECINTDCKAKMPLNEIMAHIENNHKISRGIKISNTDLSSTCEGSLTMNEEYFGEDCYWFPTYITHDSHEFLFKKVRENKAGIWHNFVCILGSQRIADKYQCIMSYIDKDGEDVLMYKGNVISIDVSKKDWSKVEGSVFMFLDPMVRKIWDGQRILYKVTVQKK